MEEGTLQAQRVELRRWAKRRQVVWQGAMGAALFDAWIYDTLKPYAQQLSMGHPAKMKAITAGKKKSDCLDARAIPPAAVQSVASLLRAAAAFARSATSAALSKPGRAAVGAYAEQDGRSADGKRRSVRQRATASEEVLRRPDEEHAGSTGSVKDLAYLPAVDKNGQPFQVRTPPPPPKSKAKKEERASSSGVRRLRESYVRSGSAGIFSGMPIYRPMVTPS